MAAAPRRFPDRPVVAFLLLLLLAAQALLSSRIKAPVFDEPAHIGAGLSYLRTGEFKVNLQHPPLLKEIAALPLVLGGVRFPVSERDWGEVATPARGHFQWLLGQEVLFNGDPDRVLFLARLPFVGLTLLLGFVLWRFGRALLGGAAAAGALALYVLDPTIIAHGPLVLTDLGFALFTLLFVFALWRWLNGRTLPRLLAAGLALGGALAAKFSAVFLLPIAAILVLGAASWIPAAVPRRPSTLVDPYAAAPRGPRVVWGVYALVALAAIAALVIHATYFFPSNPFLYVTGLRMVNADHDPTYWPYLAGRFQPHFLSYYLVALLLKEPLPHLLLAGLGLVALLRRGAASTMDRAFLLLPPAALFAAYSLFSHNLGFRYLIPVLPFLHLAGGAGLARLVGEGAGRPRLIAAVVLLAWAAAGAAGIWPDHLSYFNETACLLTRPGRIGLDGGTACGPLWLDDSNVDWGQGLKQLRAWLDRHHPGRPIFLAYFGSIRPESYGIDHRAVRVEDLLRPPIPGLYALSVHHLARARGEAARRPGGAASSWFLARDPVAVVGHAYAIYEVPPPGGG